MRIWFPLFSRFLGGIILVFTTGFALAAAPAESSPLKVFVLAGQSNMEGHALSAELPPSLRQPQSNVLIFQKGAWIMLEPGKTFGPEITFGLAMAKHFGQPIGIIKFAVGGTNLAVQWSPDDSHSLYAKLLLMVKEAQTSRPITLMGMLWMQGERDSRDQAMANAYQKNLIHLIESARRDFGDPAMPFICGRVNPSYPYVDIVRKAMETINLPAYLMVDCDGLAKGSDNLHYNATGQQELGARFAAGTIDLLGENTIPKNALQSSR